MKGTSALLFCPVLLASCGGEQPDEMTNVHALQDTLLTARAATPEVFSVLPSMPETLFISWEEPEPALIYNPLLPGEGVEVLAGDTLLLRTDELESLEMERLEMELAFLEAAFSASDSSNLRTFDSLTLYLEGLDGMVPFRSPVSGVLISIADSGAVEYGDLLATLVILTDSLFTLLAPDALEMHFWPETSGTCRLIESVNGRAVYSGVVEGEFFSFQGSWSIPRQALYERGLDHFVITADGDTIQVMRLATSASGVVVTSALDLELLDLVLWAAPGN